MGNENIPSDVEVLYTAEQIRHTVEELARTVEQIVKPPITVVPILDASIFFCADFMRALDIPGPSVYLAPMQVKTRSTIGPPTARLLTPIDGNTQIVLLDTVIDTGTTLKMAVDELAKGEYAPPRTPTLVAALMVKVDKCQAGEVFSEHNLHIYASAYIPDDPWLVGYGMDTGGLYRGLDFIGVQDKRC